MSEIASGGENSFVEVYSAKLAGCEKTPPSTVLTVSNVRWAIRISHVNGGGFANF